MKDFRELQVWRRGHELTLAIYDATATFPRDELYGLRSQLRRSCASVPANIAEGCGRDGDAEQARYLKMAAGSASELEYHLPLARNLDLLDLREHCRLTNEASEIKRMLTAFIKRLKEAPQTKS